MASEKASPAAAAASSQSDTESVASPATVSQRDLDTVEGQLRVLADRRVRVEAELLHITCEETFLRRQQRRLLHHIFPLKHGEDADAAEDGPLLDFPSVPAPEGPVLLDGTVSQSTRSPVGHPVPNDVSDPYQVRRRSSRSRCHKRPTLPPLLVLFQASLCGGLDTCVVVVPCLYPVLKAFIARYAYGGADEDTNRGCARAPVLPGVNVEKAGHQNGKAHLRVPPCTWVRKTPAPRKKRAAETPLGEVEEAIKGAITSDAAGDEKL